VTANPTDSLTLPPVPTDRRPAIWPWLVMPLVTLALFYSLYSLDREHGNQDQGAYRSAAQPITADTSSDDTETR
jgi:hypothetical protein